MQKPANGSKWERYDGMWVGDGVVVGVGSGVVEGKGDDKNMLFGGASGIHWLRVDVGNASSKPDIYDC